MCVCLSVSVSLAGDSSEAIEVIIFKLGTVTVSDMIMYGMLIIIYIDLDLHSRSHILIMKRINVRLFQKLFQQSPSSFAAVKIV